VSWWWERLLCNREVGLREVANCFCLAKLALRLQTAKTVENKNGKRKPAVSGSFSFCLPLLLFVH
jgi:hypothetical protein